MYVAVTFKVSSLGNFALIKAVEFKHITVALVFGAVLVVKKVIVKGHRNIILPHRLILRAFEI